MFCLVCCMCWEVRETGGGERDWMRLSRSSIVDCQLWPVGRSPAKESGRWGSLWTRKNFLCPLAGPGGSKSCTRKSCGTLSVTTRPNLCGRIQFWSKMIIVQFDLSWLHATICEKLIQKTLNLWGFLWLHAYICGNCFWHMASTAFSSCTNSHHPHLSSSLL